MSQPRSAEAPHPSLKAMLVCDRAVRDPATRKVTLFGLFDRIGIPDLPADYVSGMSVYARLTDAQGRYRFRLELVRLEDEQAIGRGEVDAVIEDRLRTTELTLNLQRVRFERTGIHEFRLFANDKYLGRLILAVEPAVRPQTIAAETPTGWWSSPLDNM